MGVGGIWAQIGNFLTWLHCAAALRYSSAQQTYSMIQIMAGSVHMALGNGDYRCEQ